MICECTNNNQIGVGVELWDISVSKHRRKVDWDRGHGCSVVPQGDPGEPPCQGCATDTTAVGQCASRGNTLSRARRWLAVTRSRPMARSCLLRASPVDTRARS